MQSVHLEKLPVTCRPARPEDKPDVLEICRHIWDGHDYVPTVWDEWLADLDGQLVVAEYQGCVIGIVKLTFFSEGDWWLEGMRVHPDYEGRGVATQLFQHLLKVWQEIGGGTISLDTASDNTPVHRMCAHMGFEKIAEFTIYTAPALPAFAAEASPFIPAQMLDLDEAYTFVKSSQTMKLSNGLCGLTWRWARPHQAVLARFIRKGHAWWWNGRRGWVGTYIEDDLDDIPGLALTASTIACQASDLPALLLDLRRLAAPQGRAGWLTPLNPEPPTALLEAGYERSWDISVYIFRKM